MNALTSASVLIWYEGVCAMTAGTDSPGVRIPPPVWYALAVIVGLVLDRQWAFPMGVPSRAADIAGWCFVAGWAGLALVAINRFRRSKTSFMPIRPASALVVNGPYRFTRNPMYVGLALLTIAFALFFATWWPIILLLPALAIVQQFVIVPEERYLRRRFGAEYEAYTRRVRRWL